MTGENVIREYGSLALAYIGDAAYEILVRKYLLKSGITVNGKMHTEAKKLVSAEGQSRAIEIILPHLTEQEAGVFRRGRNSKPHSHPKNADLSSYHNATGFEALFGFLYLCDKNERMQQLFDMITEGV